MDFSKYDAPGLKTRKRQSGDVAYYWVAGSLTRDTKGFQPPTVRLHGTADQIAARCRILSAELKEWLAGYGKSGPPRFDGTLASAIGIYRKTPESPYNGVKYNTRKMYDESLDLLERTVGARRLDALTGLDFTRWYNKLKEPAEEGGPERMRRAYKAIQLLRVVVKFGVIADDPTLARECTRLSIILAAMQFASPAARKEYITFEQARAICMKAKEAGRLSIAIAQAMQFDLTMRQIDIIGMWEPATQGDAGFVDRGQRWSGGVLWSHIDKDWILRKQTTKRGVHIEHDLREYPLTLELLKSVPNIDRVGPIVRNDANGMPYRRRHFADLWRSFADQAGVPKDVFNRDSRSGGITEGSDAGADIEHLRLHAGHSDIHVTGRYNRGPVEKSRVVARIRQEHRKK